MGIELERSTDRFGMKLRRSGRAKALRAIPTSTPRASGSRVEYPRKGVVEWYANGPLGLEQGFTLSEPVGRPEDGPVTLDFALEGGLEATLDADARGATLLRAGAPVLRYAGLASIDAEGRALPTWLELDDDGMRLKVDDTDARYPITIDPVLSSVRLTNNRSICTIGGFCESGNAGDEFGASVAVSSDGNTVAVAAPFATGSNPGSGAVYVFRKPSFGGWSGCITIGCYDYVAKLTSTPGLTQKGFGAAVAISGDASTIAVLADTLGNADSGAGIVYVYQRPTTGWTSTGSHAAILSLTSVSETPCGFQGNATDCNTEFTSSLDVDGTGSTIVLGYSGALVGGRSKGAAYVYVRPTTGWANSFQPFKL
ncbi:FG-GAP repeat protein, partial [Myxococcota bacterium]|nr:FG-GAP repeat protein [Myxococcota bacterium]